MSASESTLNQQAVILVGGKGTRLGKLTEFTPKPLMALDENRIFLDEVIFLLARHGFRRILLLAGYLADQVRSRYDEKVMWGASISVSAEHEPAGTAGALAISSDRLEDQFLLLNGDTLFDVNLTVLQRAARNNPSALAVMALHVVVDEGRYGSVLLEGGKITEFEEKRRPILGQHQTINAGIMVLRKEILDYIKQVPSSLELDVLPKLAKEGKIIGVELPGYFVDIGLPETLLKARKEIKSKRPTLFLDRDGTLNVDRGYTHRCLDLEWIPGAKETVRRANDLGFLVIVVTNQSGVARGYYSMEDVTHFHTYMSEQLVAVGAHIDEFYVCPFHSEAKVEKFRHENHFDRKPNPGMLLKALAEWPVDINRSVVVGDQLSDVEAASRVGLRAHLFKGGNMLEEIGNILEQLS